MVGVLMAELVSVCDEQPETLADNDVESEGVFVTVGERVSAGVGEFDEEGEDTKLLDATLVGVMVAEVETLEEPPPSAREGELVCETVARTDLVAATERLDVPVADPATATSVKTDPKRASAGETASVNGARGSLL